MKKNNTIASLEIPNCLDAMPEFEIILREITEYLGNGYIAKQFSNCIEFSDKKQLIPGKNINELHFLSAYANAAGLSSAVYA